MSYSYEYLSILTIMLAVTFLLEKTHKIHLYKSLKERVEIIGLFFIVGVVWDTFAIWRHHWVFPSGNLGIVIGLMPLEEYLFILIVPYFVLTLYKLMDSKFR